MTRGEQYAELRAQGWKLREIAEKFGVTITNVCHGIKYATDSEYRRRCLLDSGRRVAAARKANPEKYNAYQRSRYAAQKAARQQATP